MKQATPAISITNEQGTTMVRASGDWLVQTLSVADCLAEAQEALAEVAAKRGVCSWDISAIGKLDHLGAQLFWNFRGRRRPQHLPLAKGQDAFFDRLHHLGVNSH